MTKTCSKCGETKSSEEFIRGQCKECVRIYKKTWNADNAEKIRERRKAYREANIEKVKAQDKAYRESNQEKVRTATEVWRKANSDRVTETRLAREQRRRAKKRGAPNDGHTRQSTAERGDVCPYCLCTVDLAALWHEAHIWPLGYVNEEGVCIGTNLLENCVAAHPRCNISVRNKLPGDDNDARLNTPMLKELAETAYNAAMARVEHQQKEVLI